MEAVNEQIIHMIPKLRRYARGLTGNKEQADDLVQDSLARALAKITLWKQGTNLQAWLFTIMHNLFVNECQRYANRGNTVSLEDNSELIASNAEPEQSRYTDELLTMLMHLPPDHREVLLLVSVEGQSYEDVAQILNIPIGTVMSRLHRARQALRQKLYSSHKPSIRRIK